MKGMGMLLGLMAMGTMFTDPSLGHGGNYEPLTDEELKDLEKRKEVMRIHQLRRKGVQEWHIDGFTVYARDEKNARRKVENAKKFMNQNK